MWNLFPQCIQHHFHLQLLLLLPLLFLLLLILLLQLRQYPYLHWGNECCASRSSWFLIVSWLRPPIVVGSFKGGQATETQTQPMKKDSKKNFKTPDCGCLNARHLFVNGTRQTPGLKRQEWGWYPGMLYAIILRHFGALNVPLHGKQVGKTFHKASPPTTTAASSLHHQIHQGADGHQPQTIFINFHPPGN